MRDDARDRRRPAYPSAIMKHAAALCIDPERCGARCGLFTDLLPSGALRSRRIDRQLNHRGLFANRTGYSTTRWRNPGETFTPGMSGRPVPSHAPLWLWGAWMFIHLCEQPVLELETRWGTVTLDRIEDAAVARTSREKRENAIIFSLSPCSPTPLGTGSSSPDLWCA